MYITHVILSTHFLQFRKVYFVSCFRVRIKISIETQRIFCLARKQATKNIIPSTQKHVNTFQEDSTLFFMFLDKPFSCKVQFQEVFRSISMNILFPIFCSVFFISNFYFFLQLMSFFLKLDANFFSVSYFLLFNRSIIGHFRRKK